MTFRPVDLDQALSHASPELRAILRKPTSVGFRSGMTRFERLDMLAWGIPQQTNEIRKILEECSFAGIEANSPLFALVRVLILLELTETVLGMFFQTLQASRAVGPGRLN